MTLYKLKEWVESNGPVGSLGRLRLKLLPLSIAENISWGQLTPETTSSHEYLAAARKAASEVVGEECPL